MTAPREPLLDDALVTRVIACYSETPYARACDGPNPDRDDDVVAVCEAALRLRERVAELERERDEAVRRMNVSDDLGAKAGEAVERWVRSCAAAQAREREAREALHKIATWKLSHDTCADALMQSVASMALARPADDSALKEALAQERERCLTAVGKMMGNPEPGAFPSIRDGASYNSAVLRCESAIRALGDGD